MRHLSSSSVAGSIADVFASRTDSLDPGHSIVTDAEISDVLAFLNDDESNYAEDYLPGWDAEPFNPSLADDLAYSAYLASRPDAGGCGLTELSPEEMDILTFTQDDWAYRCDLAAEAEAIESGPVL